MKIKLIVSVMLLIFISLSAVAQESHLIVLKTAGNVTSAQEQLLANALGYLNQFWSDQEK